MKVLAIPDLHCVPTYSEVLTRNGWKRIDEVSVGEEIIVSDLDANLSYSPILGLVPKREEKVVTFKRQNVQFKSTLGHRNLVLVHSSKGGSVNKIRTTEEIFKNSTVGLKATGTKKDYAVNYTPEMLKLVGFCLGDGTRDTDNWKINIKRQRKVDYLSNPVFSDILTKNVNGDYTVFRLRADYTKLVDQFMGRKKEINWQTFCSLNSEMIDLVMEGIIESNGSKLKDRKRIELASVRKEHITLIQTLCHLSGKLATNGKIRDNSNSTFPSNKPLYNMCFFKNESGAFHGTYDLEPEMVEVSCVNVESGLFLMKQGDSICITGNCPFEHKDTIPFLKEVKRIYKPDRVVCLGDEIDHHSISEHDSDPEGMSAGDELKAAIEALQPLYELFPVVDSVESNHISRPYRKAYKHGIPKSYLRDYRDFLKAPKGWNWHPTVEIDGVIYEHGESFIGKDAHLKHALANMQSTVIGHQHSHAGIAWSANPKSLIFGFNVGCLIDNNAYAFAYGKKFKSKPILGCGIIIDGLVPIFIPMLLDKKGNWIGKLKVPEAK